MMAKITTAEGPLARRNTPKVFFAVTSRLIALLASSLALGCTDLDASKDPPVSGVEGAIVKGGTGNGRKHNFIGVYQPSTSTWRLKMDRPGWSEGPSGDIVFAYGNPNDTALVGDWDGDGVESQGVWRAGTWFLANSLQATADFAFAYGNPTDTPVVGDWDGNGTTTPGVFRAGTFFLKNSNTTGNADSVFTFGEDGDIPLAGDWNGDGIDTVGVYRPSTSTFFLINQNVSNRPADIILPYGDGGAPVVGDWNEDGASTIGIRSGTTFLLTNNLSSGLAEIVLDYGASGDIPVTGNWKPSASPGYSTTPAVLANFFPLGVYFQTSSTFAKWKGRGINTVVQVDGRGDTVDSWTQAANQAGLKMIRDARQNNPTPPNGQPTNDDTNEPNLLAWYIEDEPEFTSTVSDTIAKYQTLRSVINAKPILNNFSGSILANLLDPADLRCNGIGDGAPNATCYPQFISAENWISEDFYPVSESMPLDTVGTIGDRMTRWAPGQAQLYIIESDKVLNNSAPSVSADQMRAEIWSAIIHGARGIVYFPHLRCDPCQSTDGMTPDLVAEMIKQNQTITSVASVLQGTINPSSIGFRTGTPLRRHGGSPGTRGTSSH